MTLEEAGRIYREACLTAKNKSAEVVVLRDALEVADAELQKMYEARGAAREQLLIVVNQIPSNPET